MQVPPRKEGWCGVLTDVTGAQRSDPKRPGSRSARPSKELALIASMPGCRFCQYRPRMAALGCKVTAKLSSHHLGRTLQQDQSHYCPSVPISERVEWQTGRELSLGTSRIQVRGGEEPAQSPWPFQRMNHIRFSTGQGPDPCCPSAPVQSCPSGQPPLQGCFLSSPGFPPNWPWRGKRLARGAWLWQPSCSALHIKVPSSLTSAASPHTTTAKNEACWGSLCWLHTFPNCSKGFP